MGSRLAGIALSVALLHIPLIAEPSAADVAVRFELSPHGGVALEARIDGHGPFRLLLDSGSTHSSITERTARRNGARPIAQATMSSATGSRTFPVVAVDRLETGPIATPVQPSVVPDMPVPGEADGLLGLDVLGDWRYTIDYRRQLVTWHRGAVGATEVNITRLPLQMVAGRLVVDVILDGQPAPLVLDTASESLVLFARPGTAGWTGRARLDTLAAGATVEWGVIGRLQVGSASLFRVPAVRINRPVEPGAPAGLLPTHGFSRVTVDGPGRWLVVEGP